MIKKDAEPSNDNSIITYRRVRKAIGLLGIGLPILLILIALFPFFKTDIQESISEFYYTNLREIFTGILCAVGLFLILYKGYGNKKWWRNDRLLTNISGGMAFGVAFIPTDSAVHSRAASFTMIPYDISWLRFLHYGCAAFLFLSFALLSIFAFTIGQNKTESLSMSMWNENRIYRICGIAIIIFIGLIFISNWLFLFDYSTLVFEALSLFSFGISWLIKGRILGDKGVIGQKLYNEFNT